MAANKGDKNLLDKEYYKESDLSYFNLNRSFIMRWHHNRRAKITREFVRKYYKKGDKILDLCCGLCDWNLDKLDVTGLDIFEFVLKKAKEEGRISKAILKDIAENKLPSNSFDIIVCTETLEHFKHPSEVIAEIYRLLKPNGIVIVSVPYDAFLSLWKPLYSLQCFIKGRLKKIKFYQYKGGHVNHFNSKNLPPLFILNNFKILETYNNLSLIYYLIAQKKAKD